MKKIIALLLALAMVLTSTVMCFANNSNKVLSTVKALGIMVGDSSGSMNTSAYLTRAQFAKMLVAATGADTDSLSSLGFSMYSDVDKNHWANGYIYEATKKGLLQGYTDLSFHPDNNVKLEEACAGVIRLLGYKATDLSGGFPNNYINKAETLGLLDNVTSKKGSYITRGDCANLFYNALLATNSAGKVYGTTIGCTVSNGVVSYTQTSNKSESKNGIYIGVVQTCTKTGSSSSSSGVGANITVLCSDGVQRTYYVDNAASYDAGRLVQITVSEGDSTVTGLSSKSFYGTVSATGTTIGKYKTAADIGIIDSDTYGNAKVLNISDIYGLSLTEEDIKYYSTNAAGEIETLVLNDATGLLYTRVYMVSATTTSSGMGVTGSYTYYQAGTKKTVSGSTGYSVTYGGALIKTNPSGTIQSMKNMNSAGIKTLTSTKAANGSLTYAVDGSVEVYIRDGNNNFTLSDIDTVNDGQYSLTGWYVTRGSVKTIMMVIAEYKTTN